MSEIRLTGRPPRQRGREAVALTLAIGLGIALNLITFAVLYDAIFSQGPGLSENATQIITGAFGGIIGILGSFLGYKAGKDSQTEIEATKETP